MGPLTFLWRILIILQISIGELDNVLIQRGFLDYFDRCGVAVAQDVGTNVRYYP